MGSLWLLVITCFVCIFHNLHAESPGNEPIEFSEEALFIMNSLFGFRPCLDEACGGLPPSDPNVDHTSQDSTGSVYTPKHPPVTSPSHDPVVEYCLPLHTSIIHDVSIIEKRHPDIKDIKSKVVEGILEYVAQFSVLNAEECEPAVKLLDFILLSVQALRHIYVGEHGTPCNYTETVNGKSDQTEGVSTTSKCDDPPSVTPEYVSTEAGYKPSTSGDDCNITVSQVEDTVKPCPESPEETEDTVAESGHDSPFPPFVGSVRGIPGVHYPNYTDVPVTSFSCADKKYIPGFYADLETGCQVFHVCYEHRRESFLCPVGTIFNQPILACDYWYSSNCSLAPAYYEINAKEEEVTEEEEMNVAVGELISVLVEGKHEIKEGTHELSPPQAEVDITKFLPVKAKVTEFTKPVPEMPGVSTVSPQSLEVDEVASQIFNKMVSSATVVASKTRDFIGKIPEPGLHGVKGKLATVAGGLAVKPVIAKAKLSAAAAATIPAAKIAAAKVAAPIVLKSKLAAVPFKAAVPVVAKAKTVAAAVPVVAKAKTVAAAVPVVAKAKTVAAAASVPVAKITAKKVAAAASVPVAKITAKKVAAAASVPVAKITAKKVAVPIAVKASLAAAPKAAVKASAPILKAKMAASAIPLAKSKIVAPALKGLKLKAVSAPLVKAKVALPLVKSAVFAPVPVVKAKLGAAAAISPLTKKALALGYMKLLKAKKLALVG